MNNDTQWRTLDTTVANPENLVVAFGSTANSFKICTASDVPVGVIISKATIEIPPAVAGGNTTYEDRVQAQFLSSVVKLIAAGEIGIGANVYAAADGKVAASGTKLIGRAITSATEAGSNILVASVAC